MAITDKLRRLLGSSPSAELLKPFFDEGIWPRGGLQRYVCQGIPKDVLEGLQSDIDSPGDWDSVFSDAAIRYRVMADKQQGDDNQLAGRYYLISAACAFHAQLLRHADDRREAALRYQCRKAFKHAAELMHPVATPLQVEYKGKQLDTYYRATGKRPRGIVVLLNSQQSCKEDMYYFTQPMLDAGLNTFLVDTPGTGTALPQMTYSGVTGLWESLREGITRCARGTDVPVLLFGAGVGGAVAMHLMAKHPGAFRAAALLSPPYDLAEVETRLKPWVRAELCAFLGCEDQDLPQALAMVRCAGLADRVQAPVLIISGAKDEDFPRKQSKRLADEFGPRRAEYWGSGSASHCLYEKQPQLRQRTAQWLAQQVGAKGRTGREHFRDSFDTADGK